MINYVLPATELEDFTFGLAHQIAANAPLSIAVMKEQLRILSDAHPMSPQGFEIEIAVRPAVQPLPDTRRK